MHASEALDYDLWPTDEYLWLPSGHTWKDIQEGRCGLNSDIDASSVNCEPLLTDLILWTMCLLVGRSVFHCLIGLPFCWLCGVYRPAREGSLLVVGIKEYVSGTLQKKAFKFIDATYRLTFYMLIWLYAYHYLTTMPTSLNYFYDFMELWHAYPDHVATVDIRRHYVIEVGYYACALLITAKNDVGRKDFIINTVHHTVTLFLLYMSWTLNCIRVGTIILFLHDAADGFIELSKLAIYATNNDIYPNAIMVVFLFVWIYSRMYIFPQLIWSALIEAQQLIVSTTFPFYALLLIGMLCVLQILHCIWTALIIRIIVGAIKGGKTKDERSDSEESDDDDEAKPATKSRTPKEEAKQIANGIH